MTLEDLFLLAVLALVLVVGTGALLLRVLGFSLGKGALITTTFLFLGFWNPIGWIVLGLCIWLQLKENHARLLAAQVHLQMSPAGRTRVEVGAVADPGLASQPMLCRGDRC